MAERRLHVFEEPVVTRQPPVHKPVMLIGAPIHTPWILEKTLPLFSFVTASQFKSISVQDISKAMIATANEHPARSEIYHYPEMMALIKRTSR